MATRIVSAAVILIIALFWRRIESYSHKQYLETWSVRISHGKWFFILTQYILLRGGLMFVVLAGPVVSRSAISRGALATILASLVLLISLMTYLGHESWNACKRDHEVRVLREAAERLRAISG